MRARELSVGDRVFVRKPYSGGACYARVVSVSPLRVEREAGGSAWHLPDVIPARWIMRKA